MEWGHEGVGGWVVITCCLRGSGPRLTAAGGRWRDVPSRETVRGEVC